MEDLIWVFAVHITCTFALTGLIWYVQLVHYPSFKFIDATQFHEFHRFHSIRTSFIVIPLMLAELITGILLVTGLASLFILHLIGLILIILIWFSTFFIQVPQHEALIPDFNPEKAANLIRSNWIRTIAWSFKSILSIYILLELLENTP